MAVREDGTIAPSATPPKFFHLADAFLTEVLHRHRHDNALPDCLYSAPCQEDLTSDMVHAVDARVWSARAEPALHTDVDIAPWTPPHDSV